MYQGRLGERGVQVRNGRSDETEGLCDLSVGSGGSDRERKSMKKVILVLAIVALSVFSILTIAEDAKAGRGFFTSAEQHRAWASGEE